MDLFTITTAIVQAILASAVLFFCFSFLKTKQKNSHREEITNMDAKMANMRMLLRAKVKKKAQFYRATFPQAYKQGDPLDVAAKDLSDLAFESGDDFQKYFDFSKTLNRIMKIAVDKNQQTKKEKEASAPAAIAPVSADATGTTPGAGASGNSYGAEFMTADLKNEFTILKIMHEMVELSQKIKNKVDSYNSSNPKNSINPTIVFQFNSLPDLQRIFSSQENSTPDKLAA